MMKREIGIRKTLEIPEHACACTNHAAVTQRALQPPDPQARASIAMDGGLINHRNTAAYHTENIPITKICNQKWIVNQKKSCGGKLPHKQAS
jgi:hypothetical protein